MHRNLFYLLVLLLPVQLGLHVWPQWAMVLGRRVDYLSPTIYLTDLLILFIFVLWRPRIRTAHVLLPLLLIAGNIFFAQSKPVALYSWIKSLEFVVLGFYIVRTKPNVHKTAIFLSVAVVCASVLAIVQFLLQHSIGGLLWFIGERSFDLQTAGIAKGVLFGREYLRAYGTFPHPNVLGGFLCVSLVFLSSYGYWQTSVRKIALALAVVAMLVTASRSSLIVFVGCMLWMKFPKYITVMVLLGSLLLFNPYEEAVVVRGQLLSAAVHMWLAHPITGAGLGNFLVALPAFLYEKNIYFLQPVHNLYLLLLAEIGLVGFLGVVYIMVRKLRWVLPVVSIALLGMADHYFLTLQQGQLLMTIMIALAYQAPRLPGYRHGYFVAGELRDRKNLHQSAPQAGEPKT